MKFIISESQLTNLFIRRRMGEFEKHLIDAARWLDPKRHNGYDDYFTSVVFRGVSDFLAEQEYYDYTTFDKIRDEILPFMTELVKNKYGDELRQYFDKEVNK